jgi:hypothetical protein
MSAGALVLLCLGCVLVLAGVGLALWYRSNGGVRMWSLRWFTAVLLVGVGAGAVLAPLVAMYLISRL